MCGIVGYIGDRPAADTIVDGLKTLEYRGYDSAGVAVLKHDGKAELLKVAGRVQELADLVEKSKLTKTRMAIGHTRWATHGAPTTTNAHPHTNKDGTIFAVHNGIIENYAEIKERLQAEGYTFITQ